MQDVMLYGGGECVQQFGVPFWRVNRRQDVAATMTRTGAIGNFTDKAGLVRSASADRLRVEWIGGVPYFSLEEARENLCLQSADLSTTWVNVRSTDASNATTSPDGTTTADSLIEDATAAASHYINQSFTKAASALAYSLSVYLKAGTRDHAELWIWGADSTHRVRAEFDLTNGTVETSVEAGGDFVAGISAIESLDDGWYRCIVTCTTDTSTNLTTAIFMSDGTSISYNGDGASLISVWGILLEQAASPSSYTPTTTVAVTRNADTLYADFFAPPREMTVYVKMVEQGTASALANRVFQVGAASAGADPRFGIQADASGFYFVYHDNGTATPSAVLSAAPSIGDTVELRVVLNSDGSVLIGQSINGGTETTASDATTAALQSAWAGARLYVNSAGTSNQGTNAFAAIKVARGVRTMADMRALFAVAA